MRSSKKHSKRFAALSALAISSVPVMALAQAPLALWDLVDTVANGGDKTTPTKVPAGATATNLTYYPTTSLTSGYWHDSHLGDGGGIGIYDRNTVSTNPAFTESNILTYNNFVDFQVTANAGQVLDLSSIDLWIVCAGGTAGHPSTGGYYYAYTDINAPFGGTPTAGTSIASGAPVVGIGSGYSETTPITSAGNNVSEIPIDISTSSTFGSTYQNISSVDLRVYVMTAGSQILSFGGAELFGSVKSAAPPSNVWTNGTTDMSWNDPGNWSPTGVINGAGQVANFINSSPTVAGTVTLDAVQTVGQINFDSSAPYTITPGTGGSLVINDTNANNDPTGVNSLISVASGNHTIAAPMSLYNGLTVYVQQGSTLTVSGYGVISGTGPLTMTSPGTGTLILEPSSPNTYTGGTVITGGIIQVNNANAIPAGSSVTDNSTLAFGPSSTLTFSNYISGTGGIAQNGPGTTIVTGLNAFSGGTSVNAGTLQIGVQASGTLSALGTTAAPGPGLLQMSGGTLDLNGMGDLNVSNLQGTGGVITDNAPAGTDGNPSTNLIVSNSVNTVFGGIIQDGNQGQVMNLAFNTTVVQGTLALTGANTYSGTTTIKSNGSFTIPTLQIGNGGTTGSISSLSTVIDNGVLALDRSDNWTFDSLITGPGAVYNIGTGTTNLVGPNTYTGPTYLFATRVGINYTSGILSVTDLENGGVASPIGMSDNTAGSLRFIGGTLQYVGATAASTDRLFTVYDEPGTGLGAIIDNSSTTGSLNFTNPGTIVASNLNIGVGGTATDIITFTGSSPSTVINTFLPIIADSVTNSVTNISGVAKTGANTWELTGPNTYSGGTTVSGGTLLMGNPSALGGLNAVTNLPGPLTVNTGGTLDINGQTTTLSVGTLSGTGGTITDNAVGSNVDVLSVTQQANGTFAGAIADGANGNKLALTFSSYSAYGQPIHTLTLGGINTYTGPTILSSPTYGGKLNITGTMVNSVITVEAPCALGGTGTVDTPVAIPSGAALDLVDGVIGTFHLASTLSMGDAGGPANFNLELNTTAGGVTSTDNVNVAGALTVDPNGISVTVKDLTAGRTPVTGAYPIVNYNPLGATANPNFFFSSSGTVIDTTMTLAVLDLEQSSPSEVDIGVSTSVPAMWTNGTADFSWNTSGNWNVAGVLSGAGVNARFSALGAGTVNLNANQTVGQITFNSITGYTIAQGVGGGSLTINDAGDTVDNPAIYVVKGSHAITAPIALADPAGLTIHVPDTTSLTLGGAISTVGAGVANINVVGGQGVYANGIVNVGQGVLPATTALNISSHAIVAMSPVVPAVLGIAGSQSLASLTIGGTSLLDVGKQMVSVPDGTGGQFGAVYTAIYGEIVNGYVNHLSNGITTSLAGGSVGVGILDDGTTTTFGYTLLGDATMDGSVGFADLVKLAQNYGDSGTTWQTGDFTYAGSTGFQDLVKLAQNYDTSVTSAEARELESINPAFMADWALAQKDAAGVPEPASLGLLAIGAMGLMSRRRRRA